MNEGKFSRKALLGDARENIGLIICAELFLYGFYDIPARVDATIGLFAFFTAVSLAKRKWS